MHSVDKRVEDVRVLVLLKDGMNPNQVARELGISKSKAYRLRERAVGMGLVATRMS